MLLSTPFFITPNGVDPQIIMLPEGSYHVEGQAEINGNYTIGAIGDGTYPLVFQVLTGTTTIGEGHNFDFSTFSTAARSRKITSTQHIYLPLITR